MIKEIILSGIGILGTLASFYGAYLSIQAGKRAKSSAEKAETARDSIIQKQRTTELSQILFEAKNVQNIFGKYSIAQDNRSLAGVEFGKDSESLHAFISSFNESRGNIENSSTVEAQLTYDELNLLLEKFSTAKPTDKRDSGKQIRLLIDDIIFKLRKSITERNCEIYYS